MNRHMSVVAKSRFRSDEALEVSQGRQLAQVNVVILFPRGRISSLIGCSRAGRCSSYEDLVAHMRHARQARVENLAVN